MHRNSNHEAEGTIKHKSEFFISILTHFLRENRRFITKIRGVSSDGHDVITARVFYRRIIHGDVVSLFI